MNGSRVAKLPVAVRIAVAIAGFFPLAYVLSKWLDVRLDFVFDVGIVAAVTALYGQAVVWWIDPRRKPRADGRDASAHVSGGEGAS